MNIVIGETAGFCYGVQRAVDGAKEEIVKSKKNNKKVYCLGEIVHNREVIKKLQEKGIKSIEELEEIKENNNIVIIRAHGIPKETYKKCENMGIQISDYTCPNVLRIHEIAKEYNKNGWYIFLLGAKKHPENIGTISFCGENVSVIEDVSETDNAILELIKSGKNKLLLISQTTYNLEKFYIIEEEIKDKVPKNIKIEIRNTICKATELRQKETAKISSKVDVMIIVGGKNSSNTKKLFEIASENCERSICVETKDELEIEMIEDSKNIGIMAGASTPQDSIKDVVKFIEKCKKIEKVSI